MNYLFFDIESANNTNGGHICSFGYVLVNEAFKIIEKKEIFIDPNCEFDPYIRDNILDYDESFFKNFKTFPYVYEQIKDLLTRENTINIGHSTSNDVRFLKNEFKRYNLESFNYDYVDIAKMYCLLNQDSTVLSLNKMCIKYKLTEQGERHTSLNDAYLTMLVFKAMVNEYKITNSILLDKTQSFWGMTKNQNIIIEKKENENTFKSSLYKAVFYKFLKSEFYVTSDCFKNIVLCIDEEFEKNNVIESINIIQRLRENGGKYDKSGRDCNLFIKGEGHFRFDNSKNAKVISVLEAAAIFNIQNLKDEFLFIKFKNQYLIDNPDVIVKY